MLKLIRNLRALSNTITEPVYADKAIVDYHKRRADNRADQMEANFNEETARIRHELHKLQVEMNQMQAEPAAIKSAKD